jgi:hypothetical protein
MKKGVDDELMKEMPPRELFESSSSGSSSKVVSSAEMSVPEVSAFPLLAVFRVVSPTAFTTTDLFLHRARIYFSI